MSSFLLQLNEAFQKLGLDLKHQAKFQVDQDPERKGFVCRLSFPGHEAVFSGPPAPSMQGARQGAAQVFWESHEDPVEWLKKHVVHSTKCSCLVPGQINYEFLVCEADRELGKLVTNFGFSPITVSEITIRKSTVWSTQTKTTTDKKDCKVSFQPSAELRPRGFLYGVTNLLSETECLGCNVRALVQKAVTSQIRSITEDHYQRSLSIVDMFGNLPDWILRKGRVIILTNKELKKLNKLEPKILFPDFESCSHPHCRCEKSDVLHFSTDKTEDTVYVLQSHEAIGKALGKLFSDSSIRKVMHGASSTDNKCLKAMGIEIPAEQCVDLQEVLHNSTPLRRQVSLKHAALYMFGLDLTHLPFPLGSKWMQIRRGCWGKAQPLTEKQLAYCLLESALHRRMWDRAFVPPVGKDEFGGK